MKHSKFYSTSAAAMPADVRQIFSSEPAADRSTGISASQAASAATSNVLSGDINPLRIAAMAINFIEAFDGKKPNRLPQRLAAIEAAIWREHFESRCYQPHRTVRTDVEHRTYVRHLLSPSSNSALLATTAETLLGDPANNHAADLDRLRDTSREARDEAYRLVLGGHLGSALEKAREGKFPAHDLSEFKSIVRNHARCFAIRTAHEKVGVLREHSIAPFGHRFAGFNRWHLMGHTAMAALAAPATIIQRLAAANAAGLFDDVDDDTAFARLTRSKLLPSDGDGDKVMEISHLVRRVLKSRRKGGDYNASAILNYVARGSTLASKLNRGDMKRDSLSRMEFVEYRIGLTASEGAAFVAFELQRTFSHIDRCIEAILEAKPLPPCPMASIAKKSLAFESVILRVEGHPDRNALPLERTKDKSGLELDKVRGSGRIPVNDMFGKIADRHVLARAVEALGFDATAWFQS